MKSILFVVGLILLTIGEARSDRISLLIPLAYMDSASESGVFGVKLDTLSNEDIDNYIIQKATNFASKDSSKKQWIYNPYIEARYRFDKFPYLRMYTVILYSLPVQNLADPFTCILYNSINTHCYHLEGGPESFFKLLSPYFESELDSSKVYDLIDFYLNTSSASVPYYTLKEPSDLNRIISRSNTFYNRNSRIFREYCDEPLARLIENRAKVARGLLKSLQFSAEGDRHVMKLYTFNLYEIEYWEFSISMAGFAVLERNRVFTIYDPAEENIYEKEK